MCYPRFARRLQRRVTGSEALRVPSAAYYPDSMVATSLPPAGDPKTLYILDISGYVFRAFHALPPMNNSRGEPTNASLGVTSMVMKLVAERKPALFAVAMDSRTPSFRHRIYDKYKANRPPAPPELKVQMSRVQEIVEALSISVFQQDGVEADDVIASLVRRAREAGLKAVVVSADKDLLQLVGDGVWMLDSMRDKVYGRDEVVEKMGVPPEQVRDLLALTGDSSDNIPGVPSVGPKTAVTLLTEHGDLDGIYAAVESITRKALQQKLIEHRDDAYLSQKLATLDADVPVTLEEGALAYTGGDPARLGALFRELEFTRLLTQLGASGEKASVTVDQEAATVEPTLPVAVVTEARQLEAFVKDAKADGRVALYTVLDEPRAVKAQLVGIALAYGVVAQRSAYVPFGHLALGSPAQLPVADALTLLSPLLTGTAVTRHCHDSKRDITTLAISGVELGEVTIDTMLASYVLDAESHAHTLKDLAREVLHESLVVEGDLYATGKNAMQASARPVDEIANIAGRAAATLMRCAPILEAKLVATDGKRVLDEIEQPLVRILSRMERTGIRVDASVLQALSSQVAGELVSLEAKCKALAGKDFNVGSPRQLEAILFDDLGLPVVKRTKTARSTDADVLEELAIVHPLPAAILDHRQLAKLKNTYLDALPREIQPKTQRIHTDFRQAVAATGRLSSTDPNLQNIPIRTELGRKIRDAFIPEAGWEILSADYSQIELRVLAHLSHDPELVEAFSTGEDVHLRTARAIFGVTTEQVTREMRGQAKTVNFAVIYGQTQFALARNLRIERSQASAYIKAFFEQYAGVKRFLDTVVEEARVSGYVQTIYGRRRALPDLNSRDRVARQAAERVARNTPIQGSAADIIKLAMIGVDRAMAEQKLRSRMLLTVHDELVFEVPPDEKAAMTDLVKTRMEQVAKLDVPLVVDHGWGTSWGQAH